MTTIDHATVMAAVHEALKDTMLTPGGNPSAAAERIIAARAEKVANIMTPLLATAQADAVAAVAALHTRKAGGSVPGGLLYVCAECHQDFPCQTIRALNTDAIADYETALRHDEREVVADWLESATTVKNGEQVPVEGTWRTAAASVRCGGFGYDHPGYRPKPKPVPFVRKMPAQPLWDLLDLWKNDIDERDSEDTYSHGLQLAWHDVRLMIDDDVSPRATEIAVRDVLVLTDKWARIVDNGVEGPTLYRKGIDDACYRLRAVLRSHTSATGGVCGALGEGTTHGNTFQCALPTHDDAILHDWARSLAPRTS